MANRRRVVIAVPLFRSPELLEDLVASLIAMADEIASHPAELLLINDSPDCAPLGAELTKHIDSLRAVIDVELVVNPANLGFVRSANRAFEIGIGRRADVLLLNSDARPRPGALAEMAAVASLDPMIGFVSPRSNNATLCNSPYPADWRSGSVDQAYRHHRMIEKHLPRFSYVPTAVGFCLYVRREMIEEFGVFDEIYGDGYNEENDLIRRCNRRGYRAVLANHAYADHLGSASFGISAVSIAQREDRNRAILIDRYPEYPLAVRRYYESPEYHAQRLLTGLVPLGSDKLRVLFDCRTLTSMHKGSFEHCRHLLTAFAALARDRFEIFVLCERTAFKFHELDTIPGLLFCKREDVHDRPFAVAMRLVQPFLLEDIVALADYAPITGFLILDTIAMDCQQLDTHGLDALWRFMAETASLIGYNSVFTRDQFKRRIDVWRQVTEFVSRCSTDVADYAQPDGALRRGETILVVGNDYLHKHVEETVAALRAALPDATVDTLGLPVRYDTQIQPAGMLSADEVDAAYRNAGIVVFPSHYEGFGLPILHALARDKPVVARDLPSAREIAGHAAGAANLHLAASTADIVDRVVRNPRWQAASTPAGGLAEGWTEAAQAMLDAMETALERFDFTTCRRQQAAIVGHRARLDAERRFHDGEAERARLQSDVASISERLATSDALLERSDQDLSLAQSEANDARRDADALAAERYGALRLAARAQEEAELARWGSSQELARRWDASRRADQNEALLNAIADGPSFDVAPLPAKGAISPPVAGRLFSWLPKWSLAYDIDDRHPPCGSARAFRIALPPIEPQSHPADMAGRLLGWIDLLPPGGQLALDMQNAPRECDARAGQVEIVMHALGCATTHMSRCGSRSRWTGTKIWDARWSPAEPAEDALFLRAAYRIVLHREPDAGGSATYLDAIASGMSRNAVVRSLLASRERFDLTSALLTRTDRGQR